MQKGNTLPPYEQCLQTPFQCIPERVGLAATAWAIFAEQVINPLAAPSIEFSPTGLNFGKQPVRTTSKAKTLTVTSSGNAPLIIYSITTTGANASDFAQSNNCPLAPVKLPSGASCAVTVTFTPSATGSRSASISFNDSGIGSPQKAALSGTGM
jgi:hypothetical protein